MERLANTKPTRNHYPSPNSDRTRAQRNLPRPVRDPIYSNQRTRKMLPHASLRSRAVRLPPTPCVVFVLGLVSLINSLTSGKK